MAVLKKTAKKTASTKATKNTGRASTILSKNSPKTSYERSQIKAKAISAKVFVFGLLVLVAVIAVASYLYSQQIADRPDSLLKRALASSLQADSADVAIRMAGVAQNNETPAEGSWQFDGVIAAQGRFDLRGSYRKSGQIISIDVRSVDGKDAYVRLSGVSALRGLLGDKATLYGITDQRNPVVGLEGKWLAVPADIKATILQNRPADGTTSGLAAVEKKQLANLYRSNEFLKITAVLPEVTMAGSPQYRFQVAFDDTVFGIFLRSVRQSMPQLKLTDTQVSSLANAALNLSSFEMWIDKGNKRISKVVYDPTVAVSNAELIHKDNKKDSSKDYPKEHPKEHLKDNGNKNRIELSLSNYGRKVDISKPLHPTPLLEAMGKLNQ